MPSETRENYLKTIYLLQDRNEKTTLTDLSKQLGVSKPTVNHMVKMLETKGWVVYEKYKPILLSDKGRRQAAQIIRKHRLIELFLSEIMGFGWEEVHAIAEQMEHIESPLFFDRMDEMLNYPSFDPHGSPIPDKEGRIPKHKHIVLSEVEAGQRCKLIAIGDSTEHFLAYLNERNIQLGTRIEVVSKEHFDNSAKVLLNQRTEPYVLSAKVCDRLLVHLLKDP